MLRSVAAVLAGFISMTVLVMVGTLALVALLVPGGLQRMKEMRSSGAQSIPEPSAGYLAANVVMSFVIAVIGGLVTQRIATHAPMAHLLALCGVMLLMGFISSRMPGSAAQPSWYRVAIPFVSVAGVLASALVTGAP